MLLNKVSRMLVNSLFQEQWHTCSIKQYHVPHQTVFVGASCTFCLKPFYENVLLYWVHYTVIVDAKNLLNSAAYRIWVPMVSVKSTHILVFVHNGELNNGWMYPIQYTDKYRHQGYGKRQKTQEIWRHRQKRYFTLLALWSLRGCKHPIEFCKNSFHPASK